MARRLWIAVAVELALFGTILFGTAGTLLWPAAWIFLLTFFSCAGAIGAWLLKRNPELLHERMKPIIQPGQPLWDKILMSTFCVLFTAYLVLAGVDFRVHGEVMPVWAERLGVAGLVVSFWICSLAFRANTFLAPVVKNQEYRGHEVVQHGPYAVVRHPMYSGAMLMFPAGALLLGSRLSLYVALAMMGLLAVRTFLEDRELHQWLKGYAEYARRVRFRLIPWIW